MALTPTEKIWHNGKLIPWDQAQVHVTAHVVNYGSAVFEGIRCYKTRNGPAIFRLKEHTDRLFGSAKVYRMEIPFTRPQVREAMCELVRANRLPQCYLRPIVLRGYGQVGVDPVGSPIEVFIACWEWGKYLGPDAQERGVDVCVSSWFRPAPNTLPTMAKAAGNYLSSQLVKLEAVSNGYTEGICLDVNGFVGEGSGENLFLVRDGVLWTPPLSASILPGITRDSVIKLAGNLGIPVVEQFILREALYLADEAFFCGTAVEITPIRSVDKILVGEGRRGPITGALQEEFFAILEGRSDDRHGWLTPVGVATSAPVAAL